MMSYQALDPEEITDTVVRLRERIQQRFPDSGLAGVCQQLLMMASAS